MSIPAARSGHTSKAKLKLTPTERRASVTLALLFAARMLGLFLLTAMWEVAAPRLPGGHHPAKVWLALGACGRTQAVLQLAWARGPDRWGRRPVIEGGTL